MLLYDVYIIYFVECHAKITYNTQTHHTLSSMTDTHIHKYDVIVMETYISEVVIEEIPINELHKVGFAGGQRPTGPHHVMLPPVMMSYTGRKQLHLSQRLHAQCHTDTYFFAKTLKTHTGNVVCVYTAFVCVWCHEIRMQ